MLKACYIPITPLSITSHHWVIFKVQTASHPLSDTTRHYISCLRSMCVCVWTNSGLIWFWKIKIINCHPPTHTHTNIHTNTHPHTHTNTHTQIHTNTHTHTHIIFHLAWFYQSIIDINSVNYSFHMSNIEINWSTFYTHSTSHEATQQHTCFSFYLIATASFLRPASSLPSECPNVVPCTWLLAIAVHNEIHVIQLYTALVVNYFCCIIKMISYLFRSCNPWKHWWEKTCSLWCILSVMHP